MNSRPGTTGPATTRPGKTRAARTGAPPVAALWRGVRLRRARIQPDPDAPDCVVSLPFAWDDAAAAAVAALGAPAGRTRPGRSGSPEISLPEAAASWIAPLAEAAGPQGADLASRLAGLLLHRQAVPDAGQWQAGWQAGEAPDTAAGFVFNLAAFVQPGDGFDTETYVAALRTAAEALRLASRKTGAVRLGNLDGCLAQLGLEYDSADARDVAAWLIALATATLHPADVAPHGRHAVLPAPRANLARALATRAIEAWRGARARGGPATGELFGDATLAEPSTGIRVETTISLPGPESALLGVEACGIAPIFSPLDPAGQLAPSALARLASRGLSPEAALAASLAGQAVLAPADDRAAEAMLRAVCPFFDRLPPLATRQAPRALAEVRRPDEGRDPQRRELPARHGGFTQKASVGGNRLYLRTGEYADGTLGEIALTPIRDGAAARALMEAFSQAVSLGLQHGVPLDAYVEAFAYSRFGPHGAVEGDPAVGSASSLLDYAFRTLAQTYLGLTLPDAEEPPEPVGTAADDVLLPLDLPRASNTAKPVRQQRGLRLVV